MAVPVEVLRRVPLLAGLRDDELAELSARFRERGYDRGAPVVSRGSSGAGFFIVAEGEATVSAGGRVTGRLRRFDYFGEVAVIDGGRRSADITADTNMRCWGISRKEFEAFVKQHPDVAWTLLEGLVARLRAAEARPDARRQPKAGRRWLRVGRGGTGRRAAPPG
jgi:CRP/FNR family cyclic AMP-dependent transcriptional regulator